MTCADFEKINKVLGFVWDSSHSDFYRKKYGKAGISLDNIKSYDDFLKLPTLSREELVNTNPLKRLYHDPKEYFIATHSSGTSKNNPLLSLRPYKSADPQKKLYNAKSIFAGAKKVLLLHQPSRLPMYIKRFHKYSNVVVIGNVYNLSGSAFLASQFGIDTILSSFTTVSAFFESLHPHYNVQNIKYLFLSGEFMTTQRLKLLRECYPNAKIYYNYSLSETKILGFRCESMSDNEPQVYHTYQDEILYEVLGGELVITHLVPERFGTPLIRYRTGDSAELLDERSCDCGERGKLLRVLGKINYDVCKIGGAELYADLLEENLFKINGIKDFQVHVCEVWFSGKLMPKVSIDLIFKREVPMSDDLKIRIARSIPVSNSLSLQDAISKGVFLPLELNLVEEIQGVKKPRIIPHI